MSTRFPNNTSLNSCTTNRGTSFAVLASGSQRSPGRIQTSLRKGLPKKSTKILKASADNDDEESIWKGIPNNRNIFDYINFAKYLKGHQIEDVEELQKLPRGEIWRLPAKTALGNGKTIDVNAIRCKILAEHFKGAENVPGELLEQLFSGEEDRKRFLDNYNSKTGIEYQNCSGGDGLELLISEKGQEKDDLGQKNAYHRQENDSMYNADREAKDTMTGECKNGEGNIDAATHKRSAEGISAGELRIKGLEIKEARDFLFLSTSQSDGQSLDRRTYGSEGSTIKAKKECTIGKKLGENEEGIAMRGDSTMEEVKGEGNKSTKDQSSLMLKLSKYTSGGSETYDNGGIILSPIMSSEEVLSSSEKKKKNPYLLDNFQSGRCSDNFNNEKNKGSQRIEINRIGGLHGKMNRDHENGETADDGFPSKQTNGPNQVSTSEERKSYDPSLGESTLKAIIQTDTSYFGEHTIETSQENQTTHQETSSKKDSIQNTKGKKTTKNKTGTSLLDSNNTTSAKLLKPRSNKKEISAGAYDECASHAQEQGMLNSITIPEEHVDEVTRASSQKKDSKLLSKEASKPKRDHDLKIPDIESELSDIPRINDLDHDENFAIFDESVESIQNGDRKMKKQNSTQSKQVKLARNPNVQNGHDDSELKAESDSRKVRKTEGIKKRSGQSTNTKKIGSAIAKDSQDSNIETQSENEIDSTSKSLLKANALKNQSSKSLAPDQINNRSRLSGNEVNSEYFTVDSSHETEVTSANNPRTSSGSMKMGQSSGKKSTSSTKKESNSIRKKNEMLKASANENSDYIEGKESVEFSYEQEETTLEGVGADHIVQRKVTKKRSGKAENTSKSNQQNHSKELSTLEQSPGKNVSQATSNEKVKTSQNSGSKKQNSSKTQELQQKQVSIAHNQPLKREPNEDEEIEYYEVSGEDVGVENSTVQEKVPKNSKSNENSGKKAQSKGKESGASSASPSKQKNNLLNKIMERMSNSSERQQDAYKLATTEKSNATEMLGEQLNSARKTISKTLTVQKGSNLNTKISNTTTLSKSKITSKTNQDSQRVDNSSNTLDFSHSNFENSIEAKTHLKEKQKGKDANITKTSNIKQKPKISQEDESLESISMLRQKSDMGSYDEQPTVEFYELEAEIPPADIQMGSSSVYFDLMDNQKKIPFGKLLLAASKFNSTKSKGSHVQKNSKCSEKRSEIENMGESKLENYYQNSDDTKKLKETNPTSSDGTRVVKNGNAPLKTHGNINTSDNSKTANHQINDTQRNGAISPLTTKSLRGTDITKGEADTSMRLSTQKNASDNASRIRNSLKGSNLRNIRSKELYYVSPSNQISNDTASSNVSAYSNRESLQSRASETKAKDINLLSSPRKPLNAKESSQSDAKSNSSIKQRPGSQKTKDQDSSSSYLNISNSNLTTPTKVRKEGTTNEYELNSPDIENKTKKAEMRKNASQLAVGWNSLLGQGSSPKKESHLPANLPSNASKSQNQIPQGSLLNHKQKDLTTPSTAKGIEHSKSDKLRINCNSKLTTHKELETKQTFSSPEHGDQIPSPKLSSQFKTNQQNNPRAAGSTPSKLLAVSPRNQNQTESTIGKTALTARDKEVTPMKSTTKGSPNKTDLSLKIAAYYSEGNDIQAKYSLTERASQSKTTEGENIQQQRPSTFKKGTNTANTYQLNQGIQQNLPPDGKPNQADNVANSQGEKIAQSQSKEIRSLQNKSAAKLRPAPKAEGTTNRISTKSPSAKSNPSNAKAIKAEPLSARKTPIKPNHFEENELSQLEMNRSLDLGTRNLVWDVQRKLKISEQQKLKEEQAFKECTFSPKLNPKTDKILMKLQIAEEEKQRALETKQLQGEEESTISEKPGKNDIHVDKRPIEEELNERLHAWNAGQFSNRPNYRTLGQIKAESEFEQHFPGLCAAHTCPDKSMMQYYNDIIKILASRSDEERELIWKEIEKAFLLANSVEEVKWTLTQRNSPERKRSPGGRTGTSDFHYLRELKLIDNETKIDWLEILQTLLTISQRVARSNIQEAPPGKPGGFDYYNALV